jgi:hypothetical protein
MAGARIFVAIVFTTLGAAFIASTGLLIHEFQSLDWLTMVVAHGHLFLFFPVFGVLALVAFYVPAVVLTHLYWNHIPYGKLRLTVGTVVAAGLAWLAAAGLDKEPRSIYEALPTALQADKGDKAQGRVAILEALADLRTRAQDRFGLASFGRPCHRDTMLEPPEEMEKDRYCFPAGDKLKGYECCRVQEAFRAALLNLQKDPATRSLSGTWDTLVFLPIKTFFIATVIAIAGLLAWWRNRIDQLYGNLVAPLERGVIIGAFAMLIWFTMDYGYQQTANVLFGRMQSSPQLRPSLVLVPWALLLLFYFLRRLGRQGELVGQISGVVFAGVAVLRYEQLNDWIVRLVGIGASQWTLVVLLGLAFVGLVALFWPARLIPFAGRSAAST